MKVLLALISLVLSANVSSNFISRKRYELLKSEASFDVLGYEEYLKIFSKKNFKQSKQAGENTYKQELSYFATNSDKVEHVYGSQIEGGEVRQLAALPTSYDTRDVYPCSENVVRDQMYCGGSWAFVTAVNFSLRVCYDIKGKFLPKFSPQYSISCDTSNLGCNGGNRILAWQFLQTSGTVNDFCVPFISGDGLTRTCPNSCSNPADKFTKYRPNKTSKIKILRDMEALKNEIIKGGPITAAMQVYDDLFIFKGGVIYQPGPSARPSERHSVIIVGWGVQNGREYFIIQNSWGTAWGEQGYFKMYTDVCDIMSLIVAGDVA